MDVQGDGFVMRDWQSPEDKKPDFAKLMAMMDERPVDIDVLLQRAAKVKAELEGKDSRNPAFDALMARAVWSETHSGWWGTSRTARVWNPVTECLDWHFESTGLSRVFHTVVDFFDDPLAFIDAHVSCRNVWTERWQDGWTCFVASLLRCLMLWGGGLLLLFGMLSVLMVALYTIGQFESPLEMHDPAFTLTFCLGLYGSLFLMALSLNRWTLAAFPAFFTVFCLVFVGGTFVGRYYALVGLLFVLAADPLGWLGRGGHRLAGTCATILYIGWRLYYHFIQESALYREVISPILDWTPGWLEMLFALFALGWFVVGMKKVAEALQIVGRIIVGTHETKNILRQAAVHRGWLKPLPMPPSASQGVVEANSNEVNRLRKK